VIRKLLGKYRLLATHSMFWSVSGVSWPISLVEWLISQESQWTPLIRPQIYG